MMKTKVLVILTISVYIILLIKSYYVVEVSYTGVNEQGQLHTSDVIKYKKLGTPIFYTKLIAVNGAAQNKASIFFPGLLLNIVHLLFLMAPIKGVMVLIGQRDKMLSAFLIIPFLLLFIHLNIELQREFFYITQYSTIKNNLIWHIPTDYISPLTPFKPVIIIAISAVILIFSGRIMSAISNLRNDVNN